MVDENEAGYPIDEELKEVQIPLWSMKTNTTGQDYSDEVGSDSSMVDENEMRMIRIWWQAWFRFLYGR